MVHDAGSRKGERRALAGWGPREGNEGDEGEREKQTRPCGVVARGREVLSRSAGLP